MDGAVVVDVDGRLVLVTLRHWRHRDLAVPGVAAVGTGLEEQVPVRGGVADLVRSLVGDRHDLVTDGHVRVGVVNVGRVSEVDGDREAVSAVVAAGVEDLVRLRFAVDVPVTARVGGAVVQQPVVLPDHGDPVVLHVEVALARVAVARVARLVDDVEAHGALECVAAPGGPPVEHPAGLIRLAGAEDGVDDAALGDDVGGAHRGVDVVELEGSLEVVAPVGAAQVGEGPRRVLCLSRHRRRAERRQSPQHEGGGDDLGPPPRSDLDHVPVSVVGRP